MSGRLAFIVTLALAGTGCGIETTGEPVKGADSLGTIKVTMPSGREVECVTFNDGSYAGGGLWCTLEVPS